MALANSKDAILEDGGPKITSMKDFLSSRISRQVTTTCTRMAVIQDSLSLLESETMAKN